MVREQLTNQPKVILDKLLYSAKETAYLLSVSQKTVRRFIERGLLETSKATRHRLITRESILRFLETTV